MIFPEPRHTNALPPPTRRERLYRWFSGRWPEPFVRRRLAAMYRDDREAMLAASRDPHPVQRPDSWDF